MTNPFARAACACAVLWLTDASGAEPSASATPAVPKPAPCRAPEHRQFDFWLGEWEVRGPAGKVAGRNRITLLHQGCVLFENWTSTGGSITGSSLNVYDADRKKWHQTWVDNSGGLLVLEGGLVDGKMVLIGEAIDVAKPGEGTQNRITWQPLPDGRVRQHWETSTDKGRTWTTSFDGYYTKQQ